VRSLEDLAAEGAFVAFAHSVLPER